MKGNSSLRCLSLKIRKYLSQIDTHGGFGKPGESGETEVVEKHKRGNRQMRGTSASAGVITPLLPH